MSALAYAREGFVPPPRADQPRLFVVDGAQGEEPVQAAPLRAPDGRRTLAALVDGRWTRLRSGDQVACLVCGDAMEPRWSAGGGVVGGRCRSCGCLLD